MTLQDALSCRTRLYLEKQDIAYPSRSEIEASPTTPPIAPPGSLTTSTLVTGDGSRHEETLGDALDSANIGGAGTSLATIREE